MNSSVAADGTFDFVVVGGGTAGSVLAKRLSEDHSSVCLLEAGPRDSHPLIHIPAGYIRNIYRKQLTWGFQSEPNPNTANRRFALPQGRVLGGSSSINGLNYVRGQSADYDSWSALGNPGWSYREVLPYFMRSERRIGGGDDRVRGRSGELPITDLDWHHPLCESFIEGLSELGIARNPDYNSGDQAGSGYFQRTIRNGLRYSAARAFLTGARKRPNMAIRTLSQASRIMFEGRRAVGVQYIVGGRAGALREVRARREVILAAGAINTPKLLQLSGVGPPDVLEAAQTPLFYPLQGVGSSLRDHYAVRMVYRVAGVRTINNLARGFPLALQMARWAMGKPSILAISPSLVHVFWQSEAGLPRPDLEFVFTPASFKEGVVGLLDHFPGITLGVWQERPDSTGHIRIKTTDAFEPPTIDPNYLACEQDQQVLIKAIRLGRKMLSSKVMERFHTTPVAPGPDLDSDEDLLSWARAAGTTVYHMVGSARMGPSNDVFAVVDHRLRVHGIECLRVADASVMPLMPSGNTNAATMMIAEKAADMILGRSAAIAEI